MRVIEHYDKLIEENNDPVYDPAPLKEYMNKYDGQIFIDEMRLDKTKSALEKSKVLSMTYPGIEPGFPP